MKQGASQHHMDGLITLLLFSVFAACVLAVLLTGAGAYQRLVQRDQAAYERRTCVQYLAAQVRQADQSGGISVGELGGVPALILDHGDGYLTRIYCYNGHLLEMYAAQDAGLAPDAGFQIMEVEKMDLSLEDRLLTVSITGAGGVQDTIRLSLRGGEGADT